MSARAQRCFPFAVEAKFHKHLSSPWNVLGGDGHIFLDKWIAQVDVHVRELNRALNREFQSLVVFLQNRSAMICAFRLSTLFPLIPPDVLLSQYFSRILLLHGAAEDDSTLIGVTHFEKFVDVWEEYFLDTYQKIGALSG